MRHNRIWYVVADGGRARIVTRDEDLHFHTSREIDSADLHHRSQDLGTERPGRGHESATVARHAVEPRTDPHRQAKSVFVESVAALLDEENVRGSFDQLVLVAPDRVLSQLEHALGKAAAGKIGARLQKDLTRTPDGQLASHLESLKIEVE